MGNIIIDQYIFCDTYTEAQNVRQAFNGFKLKFYSLGRNASIYAKRFIRKNNSKYHPYSVIVSYKINYDGEFEEYGYLDKKTKERYPELSEKLKCQDEYEKIDTIHYYECLEENTYRDIVYYQDFNFFFDKRLIPLLNNIFIASVIAFANKYNAGYFSICYTEKGMNYERVYSAHKSFGHTVPNEIFPNCDTDIISLATVWAWMKKRHKYKKDRLDSVARPVTALTYALNRNNHERIFYSVVGLESVFTKSEHKVRKQLKDIIPFVFKDVSEQIIDELFSKRSNFAHGDILFPDFYENEKVTHYWSDASNTVEKSTALLIMTIRELVKQNAIQILRDDQGKIVYINHHLPSWD